MSWFLLWNHGKSSSRIYVHIGLTTQSNESTSARLCRYWNVIHVFQVWLACHITPPIRARLVMGAALWDIQGSMRSVVAIKIPIVLPSLRACAHSISPFLSCNYPSWTMFAELGTSVPPRYWLGILVIWLSPMTPGISEIGWGWTSSRVSITAWPPAFSISNYTFSNRPHPSRY